MTDDGTTLTGTITYPAQPCGGTRTPTAYSSNRVIHHCKSNSDFDDLLEPPKPEPNPSAYDPE